MGNMPNNERREANGPPEQIESAIVRRHLARIVESPPFLRAPRMQTFLSFIVGETLNGRASEL